MRSGHASFRLVGFEKDDHQIFAAPPDLSFGGLYRNARKIEREVRNRAALRLQRRQDFLNLRPSGTGRQAESYEPPPIVSQQRRWHLL